jgi:hypothetical protein
LQCFHYSYPRIEKHLSFDSFVFCIRRCLSSLTLQFVLVIVLKWLTFLPISNHSREIY